MKAEQYNLINEGVKLNLIAHIRDLPADGKRKVVISDAGSKSARQRGLQWRWYTDVAQAGIGGAHEDTKEGVHLVSKYRWALPILIRDDEFFAQLWSAWSTNHQGDEDALRWFVDTQIHTEKFTTSQMAEYLTEFQRHYGQLVNLTDPDDRGLLEFERRVA